VKNGTDTQKRVTTLLLMLAGVLCTTIWAYAGQESYDINLGELRKPSYDIDLRELRRTPPRRAKAKRKTRPPRRTHAAASAPTSTGDGSSIYIVRPGDHIFLILSRRYGLSDTATERMTPRVMQMNSIRNPNRLTVGRRLIIPLNPPGMAPSPDSGRNTPPPSPVPTPLPQPPTAPATPSAASPTPVAAPEVPTDKFQTHPVAPEPVPTEPQRVPPTVQTPSVVAPQASPVAPPSSPAAPRTPAAMPPAAPKIP
jgi:hypothetical protein